MSDKPSQKKPLIRKLSPAEKTAALKSARKKGLPKDWGVEWDNKREKKIWVSPDGSRKCYSVPQALKYAVKIGQVLSAMGDNETDNSQQSGDDQHSTSMPMHHRKLTAEEVAQKIGEGKKNGLPDGWTVVWDNMSNQRVWISPDGKKKCKGIPGALAYSVKCGWITTDKIPQKYSKNQTKHRTLSPDEVQEFLKEAKEKGLPDGWSVEWNNAKHKKRWIAPDGCKVQSMPEALRMSLKKGWITKLPDSGSSNKTTTSAKSDHQASPPTKNLPEETQQQQEKDKSKSIPARRIQHIPSGNRRLTESEQLASMEEAKARGLEGGWKAEFNNHLNRRIWISPTNDGLKYASIADALAGVSMPDDFSYRPKKKMPQKSQSSKKAKRTTSRSEQEGSSKTNAISRKTTKRKRKVNGNGVKGPTQSLEASHHDPSTSIPRKKRRNHDTRPAMALPPDDKSHTKSESIGLGDDESSDGEILEHDQNDGLSDNHQTRKQTASAGKEMHVVVERDSDERCIVVL